MRIEPLQPDLAFYRAYRDEVEAVLRETENEAARPCPGCAIPCPSCGSTRCTCACSPDCQQAPNFLSSEREEYPVELGIVPLVYSLSQLWNCHPCWSCEGHLGPLGELRKLPRVWFYTRSLVIPNLLGEHLSDLSSAHKLKYLWCVGLVHWGNGLDITFSVEPKFFPDDKPELDRLRRDVGVIASTLPADIAAIARHRLAELDRTLAGQKPLKCA